MKKLLLGAAMAAILSISTPGHAADKYVFDKTHTQIIFFVKHLGFSFSEGEFLDFDGGFTFDIENPEQSSIDVTINTDSIDMDDEAWDKHMKNEDFFNVAEYPTMAFKSTLIEVTGEDTAKITGDLTILDVTKPVTLDVKMNGVGKSPMGNDYKAGFSATANIKRSEWGMTYGLPNIADDVEIRIEVEAVRDEEQPE
ncbi:MAG: hypothetical protein CMH27_08130 [Micavibrio sp.]|mgnify:FL=1|nr:hypothetical protein [Micavibrio sp.]|tara:strand:+ start:3335 stop:3925 length:591 start_codon:yes stop_codon:yes gene_type:complete